MQTLARCKDYSTKMKRKLFIDSYCTLLAEYGGHVGLTRQWAYYFRGRMKFVRRKATTLKSKYSPADFDDVKKRFLDEVCEVVEMEEIPPELILNWDQTPLGLNIWVDNGATRIKTCRNHWYK